MGLLFLGGLHKMCMFHEPEGFWPTIFLHIFSGALKNHYPVTSRALPSIASSEKVNCSSLNFTATSRKHFDHQNPPFSCKSLPKSEKNALVWGSSWLKFTLGTLILGSQRVHPSCNMAYCLIVLAPRPPDGTVHTWSTPAAIRRRRTDL